MTTNTPLHQVREGNVALRWLLLHTAPLPPTVALHKRTRQLAEVAPSSPYLLCSPLLLPSSSTRLPGRPPARARSSSWSCWCGWRGWSSC